MTIINNNKRQIFLQTWRSSAVEIDGRIDDLQSLSCIWRWPTVNWMFATGHKNCYEWNENGNTFGHSVSTRTKCKAIQCVARLWSTSSRLIRKHFFLFYPYAFVSIICFSFAFRCFVNWRIQLTFSWWPPWQPNPIVHIMCITAFTITITILQIVITHILVMNNRAIKRFERMRQNYYN